MSRIGKLPIQIPDKVTVTIDGTLVKVKGPLGELSQETLGHVGVKLEEGALIVEKKGEEKQDKAYQGLYRSLLFNMVSGVSEGYKKELDIVGVGYKAELKGNAINLQLGYSHPIDFELPKGISAEVDPKTNHIVIKGADKQAVGQIAANIRRLRPPEPYKGKGVKYTEEIIRRKAGKTAGK